MVYAALVSALHIRVDSSVSGFVLECIIRRWVPHACDPHAVFLYPWFVCPRFLALAHVDPLRKHAGDTSCSVVDMESPESKLANNLLLFLCYLCLFNTVHANMMFDVLDLLAARLSEVRCLGVLRSDETNVCGCHVCA
jgi:hypothetical protein